MAGVTDCFSTDDFTDAPDGLLHVKLKSGGGLSHNTDGLSVVTTTGYEKHDEHYYGSYDLSAFPIASGIASPAAGPASPTVDVMTAIANPYASEMVIEMHIKADLIVFGSETDAGSGALKAMISPDGVLSYQEAQYTQFKSSGGGGFSTQGFNSWSGPIFWTVPIGWTGTPRCVLVYANFGGVAAGFIQSTLIESRIHIHRH